MELWCSQAAKAVATSPVGEILSKRKKVKNEKSNQDWNFVLKLKIVTA